MDQVSGKARIVCQDPTVKYGSITIETEFQVFCRGKEFFTTFSTNGEPIASMVTRNGIDVDALMKFANERCLAAYIHMKKLVEGKKKSLYVSERWLEQRKADDAAEAYE